MNSDEMETLDAIHERVQSMHTDVEVIKSNIKRVDEKTDRMDQRVFGPDGLEARIDTNTSGITRLNVLASGITALASTFAARILHFI